jgi:predicted O-methyltransferase YrrM
MEDILKKLKYSQITKKYPSYRIQNLLDSLAHAKVPGQILEFGVYRGHSINKIADARPNDTVYGFDSFNGLPEKFMDFPARTLDSNGICPTVLPNVKLIQGLFIDTLPLFEKDIVSFMHIDCDLYSSTKCVLDNFANYIVRGTVVVFDEFFQPIHTDLPSDEYLAFTEFVEKYNKDYRIISLGEDAIWCTMMFLN